MASLDGRMQEARHPRLRGFGVTNQRFGKVANQFSVAAEK
jgi:hypothetical protein